MPISRFAVTLYVIGALSGLISVGAAALAAHALDNPQAVDWFKQASAFQMSHALAMIIAAAFSDRVTGNARRALRGAALLFAVGAILFPGGLYSASFGGPLFFAPWGGTAALIGWAAFALGALLSLKKT
jgi:uncharacterized membrane protein YgdD (TMEM256/DUF423 family)